MKTRLIFLIAASLCFAASTASADYAAGVSFYKKQHYAECIRELRAYTENVITSYSIHYTKLYDGFCGVFSNGTVRVCIPAGGSSQGSSRIPPS